MLFLATVFFYLVVVLRGVDLLEARGIALLTVDLFKDCDLVTRLAVLVVGVKLVLILEVGLIVSLLCSSRTIARVISDSDQEKKIRKSESKINFQV